MKSCLSEAFDGAAKIDSFEKDFDKSWLERQGIVVGAKIEILKICKSYVLFYLNGVLCAIDKYSASKIFVEV